MDSIYRTLPLNQIPWNQTEPPQLLVSAVESGRIKPCRVVDLGCGAGNYAVWLADKGFDVTGLDISEKAIGFARDLAASKGVTCTFDTVDLLGDLSGYYSSFDLAYDWELLHHIFPEDRPRYVKNVHDLLGFGGTYVSLCFSDKDASFGGKGKYRNTTIGTKLYFSSELELRDLFAPHFDILELKTVEIPGKRGPHLANEAWLKRR
jgi:SAM-dependent methyltransferase